MNTEALLLMVITQVLVTLMAGYFLYRVMTTPPRKEPDSYIENDDRPR